MSVAQPRAPRSGQPVVGLGHAANKDVVLAGWRATCFVPALGR